MKHIVRAAWLAAVLCAAPVAGADDPEHAIEARLASSSLLLDVARGGKRLFAVGERGHILTSDDGGESWIQSSVPTRANLTAVFFLDERLGWAVGHDAVIIRTRDGGATWERVHHAPEEERPLLDVWFESAERGLAIGAYGYFLTTIDGGASWSSGQVSEDDFHLNHIADAGNGRLFIAAEAGIIYRSDDTGRSWEELPSPYEGSLFASLPLDAETVLVCGLRGHLFRSEDGGESWTEIDTGTESLLTDAVSLGDEVVVVGGLAGSVLVSTDGGRSFTLRQQADRLGISAMTAISRHRLLAAGEGGVRFIDGLP